MNAQTVIRGLALAAAVAIPSIASAAPTPMQIAQVNGYGGGEYGGGYGEHRGNVVGVVAYFSGYNLDLDNGPHVNLHHGTVINPTGATLRRGMQVAVRGHLRRDGTIDADVIDIVGGFHHRYNNY